MCVDRELLHNKKCHDLEFHHMTYNNNKENTDEMKDNVLI